MKSFLCLVFCNIFVFIETANPRALNVALDTVIEFNNKDLSSDLKLINNVQKFLSKVKNVIGNQQTRRHLATSEFTFKDFVGNAIDTLKSYDDDDLEDVLKVINNEIRKFNYKGSKLHELLENDEIRRFVAEKLGAMMRTPVHKIKRSMDGFMKTMRKGNMDKKLLKLINYVNSLYQIEQPRKLINVLNNLQAYKSKSKRSVLDLVRIIKQGLRNVFFDYFSNLNANIIADLKMKIESYCRETSKLDVIINNIASKKPKLATTTTTAAVTPHKVNIWSIEINDYDQESSNVKNEPKSEEMHKYNHEEEDQTVLEDNVTDETEPLMTSEEKITDPKSISHEIVTKKHKIKKMRHTTSIPETPSPLLEEVFSMIQDVKKSKHRSTKEEDITTKPKLKKSKHRNKKKGETLRPNYLNLRNDVSVTKPSKTKTVHLSLWGEDFRRNPKINKASRHMTWEEYITENPRKSKNKAKFRGVVRVRNNQEILSANDEASSTELASKKKKKILKESFTPITRLSKEKSNDVNENLNTITKSHLTTAFSNEGMSIESFENVRSHYGQRKNMINDNDPFQISENKTTNKITNTPDTNFMKRLSELEINLADVKNKIEAVNGHEPYEVKKDVRRDFISIKKKPSEKQNGTSSTNDYVMVHDDANTDPKVVTEKYVELDYWKGTTGNFTKFVPMVRSSTKKFNEATKHIPTPTKTYTTTTANVTKTINTTTETTVISSSVAVKESTTATVNVTFKPIFRAIEINNTEDIKINSTSQAISIENFPDANLTRPFGEFNKNITNLRNETEEATATNKPKYLNNTTTTDLSFDNYINGSETIKLVEMKNKDMEHTMRRNKSVKNGKGNEDYMNSSMDMAAEDDALIE